MILVELGANEMINTEIPHKLIEVDRDDPFYPMTEEQFKRIALRGPFLPKRDKLSDTNGLPPSVAKVFKCIEEITFCPGVITRLLSDDFCTLLTFLVSDENRILCFEDEKGFNYVVPFNIEQDKSWHIRLPSYEVEMYIDRVYMVGI